MKGLKQYLQSHPEIEDVFLNEKGEWLFSKNDRHPIHKTRNEILDMEDSEEDEGEISTEELVHEALEAMKVQNAELSDQITLLQLEKEALQAENEDLQKALAASQTQVITDPPVDTNEPATEPESKKDKNKK